MVQIVDDYTALLSGNYWNGIETSGTPVIVTFSFPTTVPGYVDSSVPGFTDSTAGSFTPFTAAEQAQAIQALSEWASASGIIFVQVAPGQGDINFQNVNLNTTTYAGAGGVGFYPFGNWYGASYPNYVTDLTASGDVFMNSQDIGAAGGNAADSVNYGTLLHEIGHAIGLKHPTQDVVDYAALPNPVDHDQELMTDDPALTIMSEMEDTAPGAGAEHLKTLDMQAAAYLYGPAGTGGVYTYDETNTVTQWSWNSGTETPSSMVIGPVVAGSNSVSDWTWNPATQTLTQTALHENETVIGTSVNDVITGLPGDRLFALDGNDSLTGAGGGDSLYGGAGNDTLVGGGDPRGSSSYGNSFYINSTTTTVEDSAGSNDFAYATASFALPENVDTLELFGQDLTGTGNGQFDTLYGDPALSSTLIGGAGGASFVPGAAPDLMSDGGGDNTFFFQTAADAPLGATLTTIENFTQGHDKIDLTGITINGGPPLTFIGSNNFSGHAGELRAFVSDGNTFVEGDLTGDKSPSFEIQLDGTYTLQADDFALAAAPCYCRGTAILTPRGEVPVEVLAIGDLVTTVSGEAKAIKWIGRRAYDGRFITGDRDILPVVVRAGALAEAVPARDLWVSPGHALFIDGLLVPAACLVNGRTIAQAEAVDRVDYFHLEFERHEIIIAEGAPAESYVERDNRHGFQNAHEFAALFPREAPPPECAPRVEPDAAELAAIYRRVFEGAAQAGHRLTKDPDPCLIVDGKTIRPSVVADNRYTFEIPGRAAEISFASRCAIPAEVSPPSNDRRPLGLCIGAIVLHDAHLRVDISATHPSLRDGFYADEPVSWRWTDGLAHLPAALFAPFPDALTIELQLIPGAMRYWLPASEPQDARPATEIEPPARRAEAG